MAGASGISEASGLCGADETSSKAGGYQTVDKSECVEEKAPSQLPLRPDDASSHNELFNEDNGERTDHAWWLTQLLLSQPVFFGTWDGVFTTCLIHLVGAIVFLRAGWIVAVSCALHLMAFAESMCGLLKFDDSYIEKAIAVVALMFLLGINLAGVKWVVRIQFVLLVVLLAALSDFGVGVFIKKDMESGVTGLNVTTFTENWHSSYMPKQNWFTILGVFFPAMTGVCAGINMSSDLLQPAKNIPTGTFSAIGISVLIYIAFILGLGATSERWALQQNYMIAEKVSAIGVILLCGLYISSMSSSLGSLYATPRILQRMAIDGVLPGSHYLAEGVSLYPLFIQPGTWHSFMLAYFNSVNSVENKGHLQYLTNCQQHVYNVRGPAEKSVCALKGPNKVPACAMLLFSLVTLGLVLAGDINGLAPIVTIPFLMTYASVEYAYFNMAVTYRIQKERREKLDQRPTVPSNRQYAAEVATPTAGSPIHHYEPPGGEASVRGADTASIGSGAGDLERLFPERVTVVRTKSRASSSSTSSPITSPGHSSLRSVNDEASALITHETKVARTPLSEVAKKPDTWYFRMFNKWIALLGVILKVTIMFLVEWRYSAISLVAVALLAIYIGKNKPLSHPGISEWSLHIATKNSLLKCLGKKISSSEQIVVSSPHPGGLFTSSQLNYDGNDYASRKRYHQTTTVQPAHHYQDFDGN
ncbi:solute carrier family 12 member 8-like isoform X3 [Varroa destructor]|uniref:Amino acid permease/ SLC12A domain-containing protein n=1 Tax=Varroa destructor TaxID=109461 RepID=A0A7M7M837_VARDE|nr:solute carrier family 12 member 8-like isoform X3 [Varroa destructor]